MSQEQFADEIGVHRTYMGGVERGERNLTLKSVEFLCSRIGVDPIEMLQVQISQTDVPEPDNGTH